MKNVAKKLLIIFAMVLCMPAISAHAEESQKPSIAPQIAPVSQHLVLRKNESYTDSFKLSNNGSKDFNFTVYAAPFTVAGEDYQMNFSHETNHTQLSRWLSFKQDDGKFFEKTSYLVKAGETRDITYRVLVPGDIPDGGQYALIFAEVDGKDVAPSQNGVRAIPRLSLVLFGRTDGGTRQDIEIVEPKIPGFLVNSNISASVLIKNTGNTDTDSEAELSVYTVFGKKLQSARLGQKIFPGQPFRSKIVIDKIKPFFAIYKVEYKVKAYDKIFQRTTLVLMMSPVFAGIATILLTILLALAIIVIKQRKERRARSMV